MKSNRRKKKTVKSVAQSTHVKTQCLDLIELTWNCKLCKIKSIFELHFIILIHKLLGLLTTLLLTIDDLNCPLMLSVKLNYYYDIYERMQVDVVNVVCESIWVDVEQ
jgi:hypothetical protein